MCLVEKTNWPTSPPSVYLANWLPLNTFRTAQVSVNEDLYLNKMCVSLLGFLLLALLMTCKRDLKLIPIDEISGEHLIKSNIEIPGTDCKVTTDNITITTITFFSGNGFFTSYDMLFLIPGAYGYHTPSGQPGGNKSCLSTNQEDVG